MSQRNKNIAYALLATIFIIVGLLRPVEDLIRSVILPIGLGFETENSLEEDNASLVKDAQNQQLQQENSQLRKALELSESSKNTLISSNIVARSADLSRKRIRIDKGGRNGIQTDQVVLAEGIVVGKVDKVSADFCTVLLIEDQDFRMEVQFADGRGVLKGAVNGAIIDRVLPETDVVKNQLVTTVANTEIPANLPVGRVVTRLDTNQDVFQQVQFAGFSKLDQISIVQVVVR